MTPAPDPTLAGLTHCGCCEGVEPATPRPIHNRPGLSAIAYRVGTDREFRDSLHTALGAAAAGPLQALRTREPDDFTVALLNGWATTLDVLSFYQERIANEGYLRTATERRSLRELARLIGYQPHPGVAASTALAFTLETAPGSPSRVTLEPGLRVQSVPGPGEQPQTFETVEAIEARPAWNTLRPRQTSPVPLPAVADELWFAGDALNLKTGDHLLLEAPAPGGGVTLALRRVAEVVPDAPGKRTGVRFEAQSFSTIEPGSADRPRAWVMRTRAAAFGHNAARKPTFKDGKFQPGQGDEWDLLSDDRGGHNLDLDGVHDGLRTGTRAVLLSLQTPLLEAISSLELQAVMLRKATRATAFASATTAAVAFRAPRLRFFAPRWTASFHTITELSTLSRAAYGVSARITRLGVSPAWSIPGASQLSDIRPNVILGQGEELTLVESPRTDPVEGSTLDLETRVDGLTPGRKLAVTGRPIGATTLASEIAVIEAVTLLAGRTRLTLQKALARAYHRDAFTLNANVANATHGESTREVLGNGDATRPDLQFTLKQAPLTHLRAPIPSGAASTLEVRVNEVRWHEAPHFLDAGPADRVFVTRRDDEGRATLQFGDGRSGARPPTGTHNIRAAYRKGVGTAANVAAGQLTTLLSRPLGLKEAVNPLPAEGGTDPQSPEDIRRNAPVSVLTLGRVVALRDYEDFARAYPGVAKARADWTWDGRIRGILVTVAGPGGASISPGGEVHRNLADALRAAGDPHVPLQVVPHRTLQFVLRAVLTRHPDHEARTVRDAALARVTTAFSFDAREFGAPATLDHAMAVLQATPGVVAVDVNEFYRPIGPFLPPPSQRLLPYLLADTPPSSAPTTATPQAAAMLTVDPARLDITVP